MLSKPVFAFLCLAVSASAASQDSRDERILQAVKEIVNTQFENGEQAAIDKIKSCYETVLNLDMVSLEKCVSQDIAYANLSAGIYRNPLKSMTQPEYVKMEVLKPRVYGAAKTAVLSDQR